MADEIGIHIRARANLSEVDDAARKLERFGSASTKVSSKVRQLVESLKETAGTDVNNLVQQIDKLQKKIQEPGLSAKERKQAKGEIDDIRAKIKELKQLQKVKADDYGSMEQNARMYLDQLKNKRALTRAEKEHIKEVEKGLAYLEKYNKAKLELGGTHLDKIQQDLKQQDEEAKKAGLGGAGQYAKRFGRQAVGLVIGGTIVGVAVQAMKKWAEIDTAIVKTSASLDDMGKVGVEGLTAIGNAFGYTKAQSLAFVESLTAISGKMNEVEARGFGTFLDWGRAMGVGGVGLQMRELQRWGGEGVKPGVQEGKDKYFLTQFTAMARMMNMREGRMTEFIETAINMTKTMERTFIKIEDKDILRNILIPGMVFGGADRGRGARGLSYMQRLNEGITGGGDLMNLMMYRTIGVPKSFEQMWKYRKAREEGAYGVVDGEPLMMGLIKNFRSMFGGKYRAMAMMKAAMPNMSAVEIQKMYEMEEGLEAGTWNMEVGKLKKETIEKLGKEGIEYKEGFLTNLSKEDFKTILETTPEAVKNWQGLSKVSAGEKWKIAIENMQYSIGGIFGPTTISLLTGLARGVDSIASKIVDSGYQSMAGKIDEIEKKYNEINKKTSLVYTDESIAKIDKILKAAEGKKVGEEGYLSTFRMAELEKEKAHIQEILNDPFWKIAREYQAKAKDIKSETKFKTPDSVNETTQKIQKGEKTGIPEIDKYVEEKKDLYQKTDIDLFKSPGKFAQGIGSGLGSLVKDSDAEKALMQYLEDQGYKGKDLTNAYRAILYQSQELKPDAENTEEDIVKYREKVEGKSYLGGMVDFYKMLGKMSDLDINMPLLDTGKTIKELRAGKLVIESPLDMGNPGTTITNHYHIIVEGGESFNLPINKETGLPDFFHNYGPVDNE